MDKEANTWGMILHLSVFAGYVIPLAGVIAPIVIWQVKKDQLERIDEHGKNVANFMISYFIYGVIGVLLCFVLIGIPIVAILGIAGIVFPIIGAVKASSGEVWEYPLSIHFFN